MVDTLLSAAAARADSQRAALSLFQQWVRTRKYKYIVDGPNVGYCQQNFENGRFSFKQGEG